MIRQRYAPITPRSRKIVKERKTRVAAKAAPDRHLLRPSQIDTANRPSGIPLG